METGTKAVQEYDRESVPQTAVSEMKPDAGDVQIIIRRNEILQLKGAVVLGLER